MTTQDRNMNIIRGHCLTVAEDERDKAMAEALNFAFRA